MSYALGADITISATYKTAGGVLTNPTVATLKLVDPTGLETTPALVNDSAGLYHYDIVSVAISGTWYYRLTGTGAVVAGSPDGVIVVDYTKAP